ncbi:uncharacterized protein KD926_000740 [Aspergillus affinis]|uniref:uncharacterized protein n=1 Tax=Aspergillus affinis TaxID=1070780 RepID=UPI0022FEBBE0|nr:uncharacterized protein KD926_000740 [Aspergillus affinis]KAI9037167.1 hypothetical protein KD926_000740 [Aspergillus affinis]
MHYIRGPFSTSLTVLDFQQRHKIAIDQDYLPTPELANIRQTLQNVQKQTYHTQSSVQKQNNQSWASVVRNAPPPAHTISSYGSSSTAPATPSELSKDREVIVKLRDAGTELSVRIKQLAGSMGAATRPGTALTSLLTARSAAVQGVKKHTLPGTKGIRGMQQRRTGFKPQQYTDKVMAQFLRDPAILEANLIFVQEPWENPYQDTTYYPANGSHQLLYPDSTEIGNERARELELTDANGQQVRIFNIYNRPNEADSTTLDLVTSLTIPTGPTNSSTNPRLLLLGDFNLYHPAWGGKRSKRDSSFDQLLELTDTRCLDLWLEPGTTTLVACEVNERVYADSDHYPIRTLLDISTKTPEAQRRKNWKTCSVKDLQSFVDLNLQTKAFPLQMKQHIELAIEYLIETVN